MASEDVDVYEEEPTLSKENMTRNSIVDNNFTKIKKKPHFYSESEDINLLKEVAANRPFGVNNIQVWNEIYDRLQINVVDGFALKRHFETLMKVYKTNNRKSLNGSGQDEDYCEKKQLLQNISEYLDSFRIEEEKSQKYLLKSRRQKDEADKKAAQKIRKHAMETVQHDDGSDSDAMPTTLKKKKVDLNKVLQEREKLTMQIEKEKLKLKQEEIQIAKEEQVRKYDLETRKLELEEKRLQQQSKEYEDKREFDRLTMQMELEQRRLMLAAFQKCVQNNNQNNK